MKNLTEVECSYDVMRGGMLKPLGRNKITPRSFILSTGQTLIRRNRRVFRSGTTCSSNSSFSVWQQPPMVYG